MNDNLPLGPQAPVHEILLAETAIKIELPPSLHRLAVERYEAIRTYIEREESPLHDRVVFFYPQGSMAIRATIKGRRPDEGYDIDIVAELRLDRGTTPAQALDLLYKAVKGEKGSRYYDMTERQTRCVTVHYSDGMHLDVTPSELLDKRDPRYSNIFHAKPGTPANDHVRVQVNSFAFCDWFNATVVPNALFEAEYAKRASAANGLRFLAEADVKPVPGQVTLEGGKPTSVVALQLLKRNRNIRYDRRPGRMPPSVMLSRFAGSTPTPSTSIAGALDNIAAAILQALEDAEARQQLIDVRNPKCQPDKFTDRWPENRAAQQLYILDLRLLRRQLAELMSDRLPLDKKRDLLIAMFGEGPARAAVDRYSQILSEAVRTGKRVASASGRVIPAVATAVGMPSITQARPHTFYGTAWPKK